MQNVEILSSVLGLLGAILLASKSRYAGLAFVAWGVSNLGWLIFGAHNDHWFFFAQQIGFLFTSVLGVWTWLVHPALRAAEEDATEGELALREKRARTAVEQLLDIDNVGLVQTPRVLHTSAPVTYGCLKHIYLAGEEEGRAMERERSGGLS